MGGACRGDGVSEGVGFRGGRDSSRTRTFPEVPVHQIRDLEGDFSPGGFHARAEMCPEAPVPGGDADLGIEAGHILIQGFPFRCDRLPGVCTSSLESEQAMYVNETSQPVVEVTIKGKHTIDRNFHTKIALGEHRRKHQIQMGVDRNRPTQSAPLSRGDALVEKEGTTNGREVLQGADFGGVLVQREFANRRDLC